MLVSGACLVESELRCFWSLWLYSLCLLALYHSWISDCSFHAEFTSLLPLPPSFPTACSWEFVGWICCLSYALQCHFRFLEGWFFFFFFLILRISFVSPLHPLLWLPQWLQEEGWSSCAHWGVQQLQERRMLLGGVDFQAVPEQCLPACFGMEKGCSLLKAPPRHRALT